MLIWLSIQKILIQNILPEAIAIALIYPNLDGNARGYLIWLIYAMSIRLLWQSAIIVHGLGHTIAIALADRELSAINPICILEHQSIPRILRSLLPFHRIFIPTLSPSPYLKPGKPHRIKAKALGGIILNLLVAACLSCSHNLYGRVFVVANLLIACSSFSDLEAFLTGVADCFYCGNFGLIARRKPNDDNQLLPDRILDIALQMGRETEIRGEQAGGGLVIGKNGNSTVFVGKKIVNRKRGNLTKSLEAAFAPIRNRAIAAGVQPLSTVTGVWHYRYATSGTAPSVLETHWHEWMSARSQKVWQFTDREWSCETKNVHHRITHNGDFNSWQIFNRQVDNTTLGLWLERVLHTNNATQGDSPKIAGMMDLLVTKGMWYPSVRLAYQQAIATAIEDAFDGAKPSVNAPNTSPSQDSLNTWAQICDRTFTEELTNLKRIDSSKLDPALLKVSTSLQKNLIRALRSHSSTLGWSQLHLMTFVQFVLQTFFDNDLYRATQIFISRAQGSFGLVTTSTLEESELVLCSSKQPITIGFDWAEGYMVYASEPAAIDRVLLDRPQSFRLDLDREGGEVAKVSAKNLTVYSLIQQRELEVLELQDRWISMQNHPHRDRLKSTEIGQDPIADDINSIPKVLHDIEADWKNPASLNCRSADYLIYLLAQKVQRFEKRQRLMFKAGLLSQIRQMPAVDLLITGEENSLWLGERFARDLKVVFPFLNIVTISANQILQQIGSGFERLNIGRDSLILAITQSGQTFSTMQAIDLFDHLSSQGVIGELFILTGELSSFVNSTQGKGGLTTITHSSNNQNQEPKDEPSCYRVFLNGSGRRIAEPSTVAVAAARQTLTELLFYLAKQMRYKFPHYEPLGMTLTTESLMVLAMMKEDFTSKNALQIIGTNPQGKSFKSSTQQTLIESGLHWANHITETPLAWAIHALYIVISVGWVIPFNHTLPLVQTVTGLLLSPFFPTDLPQILAPVVTALDIAVYIFGAWLWTLAIRYFQGRQLLARTGKRTLIIGDVSWVNQLLQAYVSKLFSLSYGIATIEVHSANPQNHLLHAFGHRVVRGTLIWLGIPDGRRSKQQQQAENASITTGKQAKGVRNFNMGAEIVAIGNNPSSIRQFDRALVLESNHDAIYFRNSSVTEQKEQIEELRESCFSSLERLLSGYVFFWALAKKVASFPLLKYEYWKSQSRTKVMTTAAPVAGFEKSKFSKRSQQPSSPPKIRQK